MITLYKNQSWILCRYRRFLFAAIHAQCRALIRSYTHVLVYVTYTSVR